MSIFARLRRILLGPPKDITEPRAFHKLSLIALLAWVGLGADGLSSSAYGPEETFRHLGEHTGLAVFLAVAMAITVFVISYSYTRIIEQFPSGGGGYLVASKVMGPTAGVVSGSALLVDYVLTITISIAAGADAIFSFLPREWRAYALPLAFAGVGLLTLMNLRGVKESVRAIAPIFALFIITHAVLLIMAIGGRLTEIPTVSREISANVSHSFAALGMFGTLRLMMHAYALGGGTYTGIEAVSNGLGIMREPRVETAKRTMLMMAISLAVTASGLLLSYLLWHATPVEGKTMNAVLLERVSAGWSIAGFEFGHTFVVLALLSEGALLFIAAQAGFVDGPRVMANMAVDSWLPHRFSALSERLTMRNGILLMSLAALAALLYTRGDVSKLVVMYAINVFVTFSMSNIAMSMYWIRRRATDRTWLRHLPAHLLAGGLCLTILTVTVTQKFLEGGWLTIAITAGLVAVCFAVRRHYRIVAGAVHELDVELPGPDELPQMYPSSARVSDDRIVDPRRPVAIMFVGAYGGLGRHALMTLHRMFPGHFAGVIFVTVAVADSDVFKGASEVPALEGRTRADLASFERFARAFGMPATSRCVVGTEVPLEAEKVVMGLVREYPQALVVAGQVIFEEDTVWNRLLHNETAFAIQRRLQHVGVPMVVLPVQLDLRRWRKYRPPGTLRGRELTSTSGKISN